jgi:hypothetical protein
MIADEETRVCLPSDDYTAAAAFVGRVVIHEYAVFSAVNGMRSVGFWLPLSLVCTLAESQVDRDGAEKLW